MSKTNFDKIKDMSVQEMAEFLTNLHYTYLKCRNPDDCKWEEWRLMELIENLFRGKRKNNGEFVHGDVLKSDEQCFIIPEMGVSCVEEYEHAGTNKFIQLYAYEVIAETVCQYTEVNDKNGTNIFHKDIVSAPFTVYGGKKYTRIGVVEYVKGAFCVNWNDSEEYGKNFLGYVNDIDVIGNVFDNPELIGGRGNEEIQRHLHN